MTTGYVLFWSLICLAGLGAVVYYLRAILKELRK